MNKEDDLQELVLEKINFGVNLISFTSRYTKLDGISKVQRKINQEVKFLRKILKNKTHKKEHLECSNLTHFSALFKILSEHHDCISLCKVFALNEIRKITVDLVCDEGLKWIKVIARNPKSLNQICKGDASYGVRSILDQAQEFAECSKMYPCLFQTPKIIFCFVNGLSNNLASKIESYGVQVEGERLSNLDFEEDSSSNDSEDESSEFEISKTFNEKASLDEKSSTTINTANLVDVSSFPRVNLDVSALLAYCSSVTNGSAAIYTFSEKLLAQQAEWERQRPQKPILNNFFEGKKLFCCQTAYDNFQTIVNTVGGPNEKIRAEEFLKTVTVLPDDATANDISDSNDEVQDEHSSVFNKIQYTLDKQLPVCGKIKERSLVIFAFGDRINAVTVSANQGFVRSAEQQGIRFVVFIHEPRALTEQKEVAKAIISRNL